MTSDDDLWRMFGEVNAMSYGPGQIAAVEQLIRRADALGDEHLAFAARMLATDAYTHGGEKGKSFVTFSWCLADFDRNPRPYHARYTHHLLWHFKYMVNGLLDFPEVPLDRTYGVLDDMERRYRDGGHSLQAVYKYRHLVARHLGVSDEAREWYRRWTTAPRDDLSDCAGCDPSSQVYYLASVGRDDEAVALAEPVLAGRLSCVEQPQGILTALLMPYLRSGRREAARDAHRNAYRRIRGNLADLWNIGEHIHFCAVTGNEARGLEIVERHLDWLDRAPSPAAALGFAGPAALVLRRLGEAGHGELTVHRRANGDRPAADVPIDELAEKLAAVAAELAGRFDARNGTSAHSQALAERLAAEPVGEYLPLSASVRRRVAPSMSTPVAGTAVPAVEPARSAEEAVNVAAEKVVDVPADASAEELLNLADEHWRTHRPEAMMAVLRAYDQRFGGDELSPRLLARRSELRAAEYSEAEDLSGAVEANREALDRYRELSDPVREQIVGGRLGVLLCLLDQAEEGLSLVRNAAKFLDEHGDARQRAAGYDRLASALAQQELWSEALEMVDRVDLGAIDDPYLVVRLAVHRAHILEQVDQPAEFQAAARRARNLSRELGVREYVVSSCLAHARALDDPMQAVAACDEAVTVAPPAAVLPARIARARALMAAGRPADAVEDYVEAVALCVERDIADGAAYLRWELAHAYRHTERAAEAAEVAEEAVAGLDRLGRQSDADQCRHLLAGIYLQLGETDPALALLDQLAENLDGPDNLRGRAQVLEEAGGVLYDRDQDALAARRFAAAAAAYQLAGLAVDELRSRRREAAALLWAGDPSAALEAVHRADLVAVALPPESLEEPAVIWEVAMLADAAARVLLGADRPDDALGRLAGVAERLRGIDAFGEALQVELLTGELLLRLDRPTDAEPVLRQTLAALPRNSGAVPRTAWLLAQTLSMLGRSEEAEALRTEYDLDDAD